MKIGVEFEYWIKKGFLVHFVFISSGELTDKILSLVEKYNADASGESVRFYVWDLSALRDEYVAVQSIEEKYPESVTLTLADKNFMEPDGPLRSLTFCAKGTTLKALAMEHKDSLFNWNIRRFLGRKGEVNSGLRDTLAGEPHHFYYFNNGISALCEDFHFDVKSKKLVIERLQVVNGAQTLGAIRHANEDDLKSVNVLVKLTAVKHAQKEKGIAAALIKTNNTQNTLRAPDFRALYLIALIFWTV